MITPMCCSKFFFKILLYLKQKIQVKSYVELKSQTTHFDNIGKVKLAKTNGYIHAINPSNSQTITDICFVRSLFVNMGIQYLLLEKKNHQHFTLLIVVQSNGMKTNHKLNNIVSGK